MDCVENIHNNKIFSSSGIYELEINRNPQEFFKKDNHGKKLWALESLRIGLERVVAEKGWDGAPFWDTFERVLATDLTNTWWWKKHQYSPSREFKAQVFSEHEVEYFKATMVIFDRKKNEVFRQELFMTSPSEFAFGYNFGKLEWRSEKEVVLLGTFGGREWKVVMP